MGRTFENRKQAILKRSDRDAKAFTRVGRQISMAVRAGGGDVDNNPTLRRAVANARAVNMPKDRVQAAIDKAAGVGGGEDFRSVLYEGYGPHGVAILVDCATDNPTRTVANIRFAFKKGDGNLGNAGSVSFLFDHVGVFRIAPDGVVRDELELDLIDHGLTELLDEEDEDGKPQLVLRCAHDDFGSLQKALEGRGIPILSSGFSWVAKTTTELPDDQIDDVLELVARLEQDDDVQNVFTTLG
jgi:YebC/PmpR family DNA-binding regulatory protein